jgi:transcriptional regulator with XRE-family HTH domain
MKEQRMIGSRIKGMRESKSISIEVFSERSGLSVEQIQLIESNSQIPSLAPLVKMARALGVRLGTFLDDNEDLGPVVSRKEDQPAGISFSSNTASSHNDLQFFSLAQKKAGRSMEPFIIDIQSSTQNGYAKQLEEAAQRRMQRQGAAPGQGGNR